jgi:transcription termination factor NusB
LIASFFQKYFPPSARHAALQRLFDFKQGEEEKLLESWTRFCALIHAYPGCPLPKNELLDIYYNVDSFANCVFGKITPTNAEELMAKISKNYDDWT